VLADLTDDQLARMTTPDLELGCPAPASFEVHGRLQVTLREESEHRLRAERDFDVLQARLPRRQAPLAHTSTSELQLRRAGAQISRICT
jgi:hypothetical protein